MLSYRKCPICENEKDNEIICEKEFLLPAQLTMIPEQYNIVACKNCGFIYDDVKATQEDFDEYYNMFSKYENKNVSGLGGFSDNDIDRFNETIDNLTFPIFKTIKNPHK